MYHATLGLLHGVIVSAYLCCNRGGFSSRGRVRFHLLYVSYWRQGILLVKDLPENLILVLNEETVIDLRILGYSRI